MVKHTSNRIAQDYALAIPLPGQLKSPCHMFRQVWGWLGMISNTYKMLHLLDLPCHITTKKISAINLMKKNTSNKREANNH